MRAHLYGISAMDIPYNEKIRLMKELNDKDIMENRRLVPIFCTKQKLPADLFFAKK